MTDAPHNRDDVIFARASGPGRAGIAVYRLSGAGAFGLGEALCGPLPAVRTAGMRRLRDAGGGVIDIGLILPFKGPQSFTGEDVVELHLHGSAAVESALYETLTRLGARPAEAGEFTRRALVNGRLDLAEVEGLADLLDAETSLQRMQALGQLGGRLSGAAEGWRARLLAIMAPLEADIDFPDEEDIPAAVAARAGPEIEALIAELKTHQRGAARARAIREGVKIAIIGAPNAGKSSLLNRLAGSERAIVAATPGTTRDVIEARLDLGGAPATVFDTAGLRADSADAVEAEGMRRTRIKAEDADIRILIIDAAAPSLSIKHVSRETQALHEHNIDLPVEVVSRETQEMLRAGDIVVFNKSDLAPSIGPRAPHGMAAFSMSAKTGEGVEQFAAALTKAVAQRCSAGGDALLSRERHFIAVSNAVRDLESALARLGMAPELAAEDVRLAARALGSITGAVDVEDVLAEIFSSFCIGK